MLILESPAFSWRDTGRAFFHDAMEPLKKLGFSSSFQLYATARQALYNGLKLLSLPAQSKIWMPAYICRSAVFPVQKAGCRAAFYDVNEKLEPDWNTLAPSQGDAVLLVHYFGLAQSVTKIADMCRRNGIYLIEDAAHALPDSASSVNIGAYGDVSLFSLRKQLPVPDGAVLVVNASEAREKMQKQNNGSPAKISVKKMAALLASKLARDAGVNLLGVKDRAKKGGSPRGDGLNVFLEEGINTGPSRLTRFLLRGMNIAERIRRKKDAYNEMAKALETEAGFSVPILSFPEGSVPRALPLKIENNTAFCAGLRLQGIGAFLWPGAEKPDEVNMEMYKGADTWMKNGLFLPVHEDMEEKHILYAAKTFRRLMQTKGYRP